MLKRLTLCRDMPIWMKVGAITFLMFIPIVSLLYSFLSTRQEAIAFAQKELLGVEYLAPLKNLYEHVPQHRGLVAMHLGGQGEQKGPILSVQAAIDTDFKALEAVDQKLGKALNTTEKLHTLSRHWQEVKRRGLESKAAESFEQHTQLIGEITDLLQYVADRSNLILDPDLDTYYLMDTAVNRLPETVEHLGKLGGLGSSMAARKIRTIEEQTQMHFIARQMKNSLEPLKRSMQVVYKERVELESTMAPVVTRAFDGAENFLRTTTERILQADPITMPAAEYLANGTEVIGRFLTLYDTTLKHLRELLEARIEKFTTSRNRQLAMALGLAVLAIAATLGMNRLIIRQLAVIRNLVGHIEAGDYAARAVVLSNDELGRVAASLNGVLDKTFTLIQSQDERDAIQTSIMKLLDEVSGVAEGDLTVEAEVTADMTGAIADSFNYMIYQLRTIVTQVQKATLQVSSSANDIQTTAEQLADGSTSQASQIIDSSAAIDEMAISIQQVSENAATSTTVAEQALANAKQGTTAVQNTIHGMQRIRSQVQETAKRIKRLGERSQEIGEIVQLIGDIADRTSILALNASIQAARAGEAGRAFVVVAEEVERLSERASNATKQIAGLVNTIQSETNEAVTAMEESTREVVQGSRLADQAGQALGEIESVSARLAELIQSISLAAKQQARGSESLSQAMSEISEVTQQTATGTKQAAVSINNLATLADTLRQSVSTFKLPANTNERSRVA
jgi:methyl-accepting chemotaxis protein